MRFFIDGEWDGYKGQLLSLAIVPEDESVEPYLYMEFEHGPIRDPWVEENVMPQMQQGRTLISREVGQKVLAGFFAYWSRAPIHIIADWPEDIERLCELMVTGPGQRIDAPRLTFEFIPGLNAVDTHSETPHNALEDARAIRKAVQMLEGSR